MTVAQLKTLAEAFLASSEFREFRGFTELRV